MTQACKISVVGNSGSGKSTTARRLAERLGLARLEMDAIHHQPDWQPLPAPEFQRRVIAFMDEHPRWVIDGNYSSNRDLIWSRAELVVWVDLPRLKNMRHLAQRSARRLIHREELWNGNRERLVDVLSIDPERSVLAWAWTHHPVVRARYAQAQVDPRWSHLRFARFCSHNELDAWIETLPTRV